MYSKLSELTHRIFIGFDIPEKYLTERKRDYYYLISESIVDNNINLIGNALYISHNNISKLGMGKDNCLEYGDYIIWRREKKADLIIYQSEIEVPVIPSSEFLVISSVNTYLNEFVGREAGKSFLFRELSDLYKKNKYRNDILKNIGNIQIPIDSFDEDVEEDDESLGDFKKEPLDTSKIAIDREVQNVNSLVTRIEHEEIDLSTKFQRKMNLWKEDVMSRLIESMLIRFPLPAFYFDGTDEENWLVVDGLQRLSTIKKFVIDKTIRLTDLEYRTELEGKTFDELSRSDQRRIEEHQLTFYIVRKGTPARVKYSVFHRLNTGALILTNQEIRHAINQGQPADYVKELAELEEFKKIINFNIERMRDRETVLRYAAFKLTPYKDYTPTITDFLDNTMTSIYDVSKYTLDKYKSQFKKSLITARELFGAHAFRKTMFQDKQGGKFSNVLFEMWTVILSDLSDEERKKLVDNRKNVLKKFEDLMNNEDFQIIIDKKAYTKSSVEIRFKAVEDLIKGILR
ncbi:DUF262 domain-containing protein [Desulfococcaceae bacterium HSG8]|nr:DUF262 domain-containing protein [Desulfococcaceae bacterium HSG8]